MKTIKQIADELGVSKTAVRKKIGNLGLQSSLQLNGNQFAIDEKQEILIKSAFEGKTETKTETKSETKSETSSQFVDGSFTPDEAVIDVLLKQSDMLQKELEVKNKQIEELSKRLEESHRLIDQQQQLQAMQQKKIEELEKKEEPAPDPAQEGDYDYLLDPEVAADPEVKKRQRDFVKGAFWSKLWRK